MNRLWTYTTQKYVSGFGRGPHSVFSKHTSGGCSTLSLSRIYPISDDGISEVSRFSSEDGVGIYYYLRNRDLRTVLNPGSRQFRVSYSLFRCFLQHSIGRAPIVSLRGSHCTEIPGFIHTVLIAIA